MIIGNAWQSGKGLRIDYLLVSPLAADKIIAANNINDKERSRPRKSLRSLSMRA